MSTLTPEESVLQKAAPIIFAKVRQLEDRYPQLNGRARRAGFLAAGGAVRPAPEGPAHVYYVASSNGRGGSFGVGYYIVELDGNGELKLGTCTCPDYFNGLRGLQRGAPTILGSPKCKHVLALAILRAVEKDQEKASVEGATTTEAAQTANRGTPGPSDGSTPRPAAQPESDAISNPQTYDDHVRRHNYVSSFTGYCQAHPEYRARRWGKP